VERVGRHVETAPEVVECLVQPRPGRVARGRDAGNATFAAHRGVAVTEWTGHLDLQVRRLAAGRPHHLLADRHVAGAGHRLDHQAEAEATDRLEGGDRLVAGRRRHGAAGGCDTDVRDDWTIAGRHAAQEAAEGGEIGSGDRQVAIGVDPAAADHRSPVDVTDRGAVAVGEFARQLIEVGGSDHPIAVGITGQRCHGRARPLR
jgi:hypothetical protein